VDEDSSISDRCKATIINLVVDNLHRTLEGKAIRPLAFIYECKQVASEFRPVFERIFERSDDPLTNISGRELRLMYKLAHEFPHEKLCQVAQRTFVFYRVEACPPKPGVKRLPAPWKDERWDALWASSRPKAKLPLNERSEQLGWVATVLDAVGA
jgi:hypothetical protein